MSLSMLKSYLRADEVVLAAASAWHAKMADEADRLGMTLGGLAAVHPSWPYEAHRLDALANEMGRAVAQANRSVAVDIAMSQREAAQLALLHLDQPIEAAIGRVSPALLTSILASFT